MTLQIKLNFVLKINKQQQKKLRKCFNPIRQ